MGKNLSVLLLVFATATYPQVDVGTIVGNVSVI